MNTDYHIDEPFLFNPLKHHLGYIKDFINQKIENPDSDITDSKREINHLGTSVMDVYKGKLSIHNIVKEVGVILKEKNLLESQLFSNWSGTDPKSFRILSLSDDSEWTIKYHDNRFRYVHLFPARNSQNTFRVKSNTLKSAMMYLILTGKDLVTANDLNQGRLMLGLSPVKDVVDVEAITEMIEILRNNN